jgi:hypothetical protein
VVTKVSAALNFQIPPRFNSATPGRLKSGLSGTGFFAAP